LGFLTGTFCGSAAELLAKNKLFEERSLWEVKMREISRKKNTPGRILFFTFF